MHSSLRISSVLLALRLYRLLGLRHSLGAWLVVLLVAALTTGTALAQTIRYVKPTASGTGDGSSWGNASNSLQAMINASAAADQVWVTQGTYKPTTNPDRTISFTMKNGVSLYGGFVGNENALNQRPVTNPLADTPASTTLSGDIGTPGNADDNSYHVITNPAGLTSGALLNGFSITGGNANGPATMAEYTRGGGITSGSSLTLTNCSLQANQANNGGAIYNAGNSTLTLTTCNLQVNTALFSGGAIYNAGNSTLTLTNCSLQANQANNGGAMYNFRFCSPVLINCTLLNNTGNGGAMYNFDSNNPTMINSVVFNNGGGDTFYNEQGITTITTRYCLFEPTVTGYAGGTGNLTTTTSPFVSATSIALPAGSPAIDGGSPTSQTVAMGPYSETALPSTDLTGNPRLVNGRVDMGAVEYQSFTFPTRLFVAASQTATNGGDGRSWPTAFADLQSALTYPQSQSVTEIWVAGGTYKPTTGTDRTISFKLLPNVKIYGGFVGNETALSQRIAINPVGGQYSSSTLSGDIGTPGDASDNSYHVINNPAGLTTNALLDGFVITGGNANGSTALINSGGGVFNSNSSPTLINCSLQGNQAGFGGAIFNVQSNPTLTNCVLQSNQATSNGGAMANSNSSPTLTNCVLQSNQATGDGGGIANSSGSSPTLTRCSLSGNSARNGGGIANSNSSPTLINSNLQANRATGVGGGVYNDASLFTLINCSLLSNQAVASGGGVANANSSTGTLLNCTLRDNAAPTGGAVDNTGSNLTLTNSVVFNNGGANTFSGNALTARYSLFETGVTGYAGGTGNLTTTTSPFASETSVALVANSPAIDAGNPASQIADAGPYSETNLPSTDLLGNPRIAGGRVDMGAAEDKQGLYLTRIYVSASQTANRGDGRSWATAFADLQGALTYPYSQRVTEMWVAAGTYKPTTSTDRAVTFNLLPNVNMYGGFVGTETALSQRPVINPRSGQPSGTILSGDLGTAGDINDNSYHVVTTSGQSASVVLDGFVIMGGNSFFYSDGKGAGIVNQAGSLTITNCTIQNNLTYFGAGIYNYTNMTITNSLLQGNQGFSYGGAIYGGKFSLTNCLLQDNQASYGGAVFGDEFAMTNCLLQNNRAGFGGAIGGGQYSLVNCIFQNNQVDVDGGAIFNSGGGSMTNCTFQGNRADGRGGVIYSYYGGNFVLTNCKLLSNQAREGGGIYNYGISPVLINCSLQNNQATASGGAIDNKDGNPSLINCSLQANSAPTGGAISNNGSSISTLTNSVFFNNGGASTFANPNGPNDQSTVLVRYSLLEPSVTGYTSGPGSRTTTTSPFVSATSVALVAGSKAINAGDNATYQAANGPTTDGVGNPRIVDNTIDMGAVEFQGPAGCALTFTQQPPSRQTVCVGSVVTVPVSVSGAGPLSYQWYKDGTVVSSQTSATLSLPSVTVAQSGRYLVVVTGGCASVTSTAFSLTVTPSSPDYQPLVELYNATGGANWTNKTNWISNCTPCGWYGVTCTNGRVTGLNLIGNNLSGTLPASLSALTSLQSLELGANTLTGGIPTGISNLTALQTLNLSRTQLGGTIPQSLGQLTRLQNLLLNESALTGSLPASLGNLSQLQNLQLYTNQLGGCFPGSYTALCGRASVSFTGNPYLPGGGDFAAFCSDGTGGPLIVNQGPQSGTACTGSAFSFSVVARGAGSYQWYKFGSGEGQFQRLAETGPVLSFSSVSASDAGTYQVYINYGCGPGAVQSDMVTLTVPQPGTAGCPQVNTPPVATANASQTAMVGRAFSYTVNAFSDAQTPNSLTYSASLNPASGLSFDAATRAISGTPNQPGPVSVTVTATDGGGLSASTSFTITVNPRSVSDSPLRFSNLTASPSTLLTGETTILSATATGGTSPYRYSFSGPGTITLNGNTATVSGLPTGVQTFTVLVTDASSPTPQTASAPVSVTVGAPSTFTASLSASPSTTLTCAQTSLTLTAGGAGPDATYAFSGNVVSQRGNTAVVSAAGVYSVTVTNPGGYASTASITISQDTSAPMATLSALPSTTLTCSQSSLTLTAGGGSRYSFSGNVASQNGNAAIVTTAGVYSVTVTNANGCFSITSITVSQDASAPTVSINPSSATLTCASPTVSLTAVGAGNVLWSTGSTDRVISVNLAGTYSVTITNGNGCSASASVTVSGDQSAPTANINPSSATLTCANPGVSLTAVGVGNVLWSTGSTERVITVNTAGTYSVTIINGNGCLASASINISGDQSAPTVSINPSSATLTCASPTVSLTAVGAGNVLWSTGSTERVITVNTGGTYSVTITNGNGCAAIASVTISGDQSAPTVSINPSSATLTCASPSVSLTVVGAGSVRWNTGSTERVILVNTAGTYSVTITNSNGCSASASAIISGDQNAPVASITPSSTTLTCASQSISLTAVGAGSVRWSTGSTERVISVNTAGTYSVTITNGNGCLASASVLVSRDQSAPTVTIIGSLTVVSGGTTTLIASGGGSYAWSTGQTTPSISVMAGTYSLTATTANGCFATASATVTTGAPANTAPTVANPVNPQSATVGVGYTLSVANTFTDAQTPNTLSLTVAGLPQGVSLSGTTISGTPSTTVGSPYSVTLTASDPGNLSAFTVFTLTISPAASVTTSAPFAITGVTTVSCSPVANRVNISFNPQYAGLSGSPVSFSVANELAATTSPGPYSLTLYPDNPVITLRAVQNGVTSSFTYNWLSACTSQSTTPGGNTAPTVANPVPPQSATVGVGYTLSVANTFTDAQTPNALLLSATGLPAGLSLNGTTISGTPSMSGVSNVTVTATDLGNLSGSTSFAMTVSPAVSMTTTPTGPFAITGVTTIDCTPVANRINLIFTPQYAGLSGASVSFQVLNEQAPTTSAGPYSLTLYPDNPVITLRAVQNGITTSFAYNWLVVCNSQSTTPGNTAPTVANAIPPQSATVGQGYTLSVANTFTDAQMPNALVLSATGLPAGLSLNGTIISGTPSMSGVSTVTVTATDPRNLSVSTTFILTVSPAPVTGMPTGSFAITGVTGVSCQTLSAGLRRLTFNPAYSGLNGQAVSFGVANELASTTAPGPYSLNLYIDNPVITLKATQAGSAGGASFAYSWLSSCPAFVASGRLGATEEAGSGLRVVVLGNPTPGETVSVEIRGGEGQRLLLTTSDSRGRIVSEQTVVDARALETQTVRVGPDAGLYMLQISTSTGVVRAKILKR